MFCHIEGVFFSTEISRLLFEISPLRLENWSFVEMTTYLTVISKKRFSRLRYLVSFLRFLPSAQRDFSLRSKWQQSLCHIEEAFFATEISCFLRFLPYTTKIGCPVEMTTLSCHIEGVFFTTEISRFQTSRTPQLTFWDFSPNKKRWDSKWQVF